MLAEMAGRPKTFFLRRLLSTAEVAAERTAYDNGGPGIEGWDSESVWGGWGDPGNFYEWVTMSRFDGRDNQGEAGMFCPINCTNRAAAGWYSFHDAGAHALLADGTVRFISENISYKLWAHLMTREGNEVISAF
jgi:hypothetical protein